MKKLHYTLQYVDAKKTVRAGHEMQITCEMIIQNCITWGIEEVLSFLDKLAIGKYGKFYERLKGPEIIEAIRKYEADERADVLVELHKNHPTDFGDPNFDIKQIEYKGKLFEKYPGMTIQEIYAAQCRERQNKAMGGLISKANEIIQRKTNENKQEAEYVHSEAQRIFEKLNGNESLTVEEKIFCRRHDIPVLPDLLAKIDIARARSAGMNPERLEKHFEEIDKKKREQIENGI